MYGVKTIIAGDISLKYNYFKVKNFVFAGVLGSQRKLQNASLTLHASTSFRDLHLVSCMKHVINKFKKVNCLIINFEQILSPKTLKSLKSLKSSFYS